MKKRYNRRSIRLNGYDYAQSGLYFVTICCQHRIHYFGHIQYQQMHLNDAGKMVSHEWKQLANRFPNIQLHEYVIMPNHFHAIIEIVGATLVVVRHDESVARHDESVVQNNGQVAQDNGQPQGLPLPMKNKTLGDMVGAFQSITTVEYIRGVKNDDWRRFDKKLWQRNYWDHIIRNELSYNRIATYIKNNPAKWKEDMFYGR